MPSTRPSAGRWQGGGRVLVSMYDHNASLRPAAALEREGRCQVGYFPVYEGEPGGTVQGLRQRWTGRYKSGRLHPRLQCDGVYPAGPGDRGTGPRYGALFILDAAQTAGVIPADLGSTGADILCAAGHKGLLGPMGTGVMALREGVKLNPLTQGGTGVYSLDMAMPEESPERYEAGTVNFPGIFALGAGIREVERRGISRIYRREAALAQAFSDGLRRIPGVRVAGRGFRAGEYVPVVSFTAEDQDASEFAEVLSAKGFMLRGGVPLRRENPPAPRHRKNRHRPVFLRGGEHPGAGGAAAGGGPAGGGRRVKKLGKPVEIAGKSWYNKERVETTNFRKKRLVKT